MLTRVDFLSAPPSVNEIASGSVASVTCSIAWSQNANDALSFDTSSDFGHVALTESGVDVSLASIVGFITPKLLQKR